MSDDEISGVHNLPPAVQVVMIGIWEKHKRLRDEHADTRREVSDMKDTLDDLKNDAAAVRNTAKLIAWMVGILCVVIGAVGGGHLALMHH